jgi:hypothetical protein
MWAPHGLVIVGSRSSSTHFKASCNVGMMYVTQSDFTKPNEPVYVSEIDLLPLGSLDSGSRAVAVAFW